MIRKSIIDRVNRYAKNRGLKVTEIKKLNHITIEIRGFFVKWIATKDIGLLFRKV